MKSFINLGGFMTNENLEFISGTEMQRLIVQRMKELMWVVSGTVVVSQKLKDELASDADRLVTKFERDFTVD
jgi:hypothetical protein